MNKHKTLYFAMAVVGASLIAAVATAQQTPAPTQMVDMTTDGSHMSVGDRIFLMDLVHANAREIELSRVALHQSNSPGVARFARHMLMEHRTLQDQLMTSYGERTFLKNWQGAVSQSYIGMTDSWGGMDTDKPSYNNWAFLYSEDWAQVRQLRDQNGTSLERMYVNWMTTDHAKLLEEMNRRSAETDNSDIKALIASARPVVEDHLRRSRDWKFDLGSDMTLGRWN